MVPMRVDPAGGGIVGVELDGTTSGSGEFLLALHAIRTCADGEPRLEALHQVVQGSPRPQAVRGKCLESYVESNL